MPEMLNIPASKLPPIPEFARKKDFRSSFHWRIFRIMAEFVDGWQFLADFKKTVTFFGSARFRATNRWYKEARKLGQLLAENGFSVITGGGPGAMEAGNRGAVDAKRLARTARAAQRIGESLGLNIRLPHEQRINKYVSKAVAFHYFFVRKVMLSYHAQAYVFFPGGYGTLDETFELLTLIQTKKIPPIPIVFIGKKFWSPLTRWIEDVMYRKYRAIDKADLEVYALVDSADEAYRIIRRALRNGSSRQLEF